MPIASTRIPDELHEQVRIEADLQGISISNLIRQAISDTITRRKQESQNIEDHPTFVLLQDQLKEKDQQISQLHQIIAMGSQERENFLKQIDRCQLLLEDFHRRRSVWQRIKAVFATS